MGARASLAFYAAAAKEIARRKGRGAERGAADQPPSDALTLDDIESEIVGGIVAERTQLRNDMIDRLRR